MPYIKQAQRQLLADGNPPMFPGELNYLVSEVIWKYLKKEGINYTNINACIGALECAKLEVYRRIAAGYEDDKRQAHGDVFV